MSLPRPAATSELEKVAEIIRSSESIVLTTHRQCDGDGLGAQLGLYHALKQMKKNVRILNVDGTPEKYHFLNPELHIQCFDDKHEALKKTDLALILDTNDRRLIEPLYTELENKCSEILFIDHHPTLETGPVPTPNSYIDTQAASTGEIAYMLIQCLGLELNPEISRAIYTSIAFDTQLFRYVRNSPTSHLIAAELLKHETNPAEIHRFLFANHTVEKIRFLSHALEAIEYYMEGRLAIVKLTQSMLFKYSMSPDDSRDLIDFIMNIDTLVAGVMMREEPNGEVRISLRSKGDIEVRGVAEALGGGGHLFAAGATVNMPSDEAKNQIIGHLSKLISEK